MRLERIGPKVNMENYIEVKKKKILLLENAPHSFNGGKYYFINEKVSQGREDQPDSVITGIKRGLKRHPKLFSFLYNLLGASFVGKSAKKFITEFKPDSVTLNFGSGVKNLGKNIINIDFYPFDGVDIVADISSLPIKDASADCVVCEYVLEHVPNPGEIINEIERVLKPGGAVYISVPFVASFHSSPYDYYRWSKPGLETLLRNFNKVECKIRSGPTSSLIYVLSEWLGTLFSFGSPKLQQIIFLLFLVLFSPLNFIDYLIYKLPSSENIAYGFYFIGKK